MNHPEKVQRLKKMLAQVGQDRVGPVERPGRDAEAAALESLAERTGYEAVNEQQEVAAAAVSKLKDRREEQLTPQDVQALEAIILPRERPVVFVRGGIYEEVEAPWTELNKTPAHGVIDPLMPAIGRVEVPKLPWVPYGGTAFVVGPGLLMTNRHVAQLFCQGRGIKRLVYQAGDAAVDFKREVDTPPDDRSVYLEISTVEMIHPFWDMAILRVNGLPGSITPLRLSVDPPEALRDEDIVAIGYPARDDRNDLEVQDRIFKRKFNVKRLQPGKIRIREKIRSFENVVDAVTHDSSTLGGNSGSAIISVHTGEVVGLHFAGLYLKANYAVPTYELARDSRVVDLGLKFARTIPSTSAWDSAWVAIGESTVPATPQPTPMPGPTAGPSVAGATATFTVPLQISVSIGAAVLNTTGGAAITPSTVAVAGTEAAMQVPIIFDGLEHRDGYQPDFLGGGVTIDIPDRTALGKGVTAKLEDGSDELRYHKFSVIMHRGRRLALLTAANVDWRSQKRLINGKKPSREELTGIPEGTLEEWVTDWRISEDHQLPDIFFTKDRQSFDKGHVVRRDDVAWGDSFDDMQMSNGDTYHTTNCTPQTSAFNQSSKGVDNWGDLENMIQSETKAEKAIVFGGPVLAANDPFFDGVTHQGAIKVKIPRKFWKIVVVRGTAGPEAYGFVLKHDLSDVQMRVEEFVVPAKWERFMEPLSEIEKLLKGLVTLDGLKAFDRFNSTEGVNIRAQLT